MLLITNTTVLIAANSSLEQLDEMVKQIISRAKEAGVELSFEFQTEPFPAYRIPEGTTFQDLKKYCQPDIDLQFKVIGNEITPNPVLKNKDIQHTFTPEELAEMADEWAWLEKEKNDVETEKKNANNAFKERIEKAEARIAELSSKYREKNEYRNMECVLNYDFGNKKRIYTNPENGEAVHVEDLQPEDFQLVFNFGLEVQSTTKKEEEYES